MDGSWTRLRTESWTNYGRRHGPAVDAFRQLLPPATLQMARRDAQKMIEQDPNLSQPDHKLLKSIMMKQHGETIGLIDVG